jgi:hypothetical protein
VGLIQPLPPIVIRVEGPAPAKDGGRSIRGLEHPHAERVQTLRQAMAAVMAEREPFDLGPVRMDMRLYRQVCASDALNLINGVADIIQRRHHLPEHAHDVWVLADDAQIREFSYQESPAEQDSYVIVVTPLASTTKPGKDTPWP